MTPPHRSTDEDGMPTLRHRLDVDTFSRMTLTPRNGSRKWMMVLTGVLVIAALGLVEGLLGIEIDGEVFKQVAWITSAGVAGNGVEHAAREFGKRAGETTSRRLNIAPARSDDEESDAEEPERTSAS